ncbi:MAG TPA: PLP-dependent aminotransferase family protein [Candidatus Binatia bacterium]|nr:PLP-dependent aminotransferase family protein [Candidatus Binatia bacterium]
MAVPSLSLMEFMERPGVTELAWGHPDPRFLPGRALRAAADRVIRRYGPDALGYGRPAGPPPLIEMIRSRLGEIDARSPAPDEVVITAGSSQGLDQIATLLMDPGDVALVEAPTYHLAIKLLRDHPLKLVAVPSDRSGLRIDALAEAITRVRADGDRPRILYTVPTFNNPTGLSLSGRRRRELVALAEREGILVVEDDAYRELAYDGPPPPSLWSMARPGTVIRLGTFSKSIAPGLRVGYMTGDAATIAKFVDGGLLDSGGGIGHFTGLMVAEYFRVGGYARDVERLRVAYRKRRDRMLGALERHMPKGTRWTKPAGGYFIWVTLPPGHDTRVLQPIALEKGIGFAHGRTFFGDARGGETSLRLAFSRYPPATLEAAVRQLRSGLAEHGPPRRSARKKQHDTDDAK